MQECDAACMAPLSLLWRQQHNLWGLAFNASGRGKHSAQHYQVCIVKEIYASALQVASCLVAVLIWQTASKCLPAAYISICGLCDDMAYVWYQACHVRLCDLQKVEKVTGEMNHHMMMLVTNPATASLSLSHSQCVRSADTDMMKEKPCVAHERS